MAVLVVDGAIVACTFGAAPSALAALPANPTRGSNGAAATIMDFAPMVNIQPFGICSSPANPQVIAATSLAAGVFTPQPCVPATVSPWVPGSPAVTIGGQPAGQLLEEPPGQLHARDGLFVEGLEGLQAGEAAAVEVLGRHAHDLPLRPLVPAGLVGRQRHQTLVFAAGPSVFDGHVLALDIARLF